MLTCIPPILGAASSQTLKHYDDYGLPEQTQLVASVNIYNDPFGYSSEYTDSETQLEYLQVRYYDPIVMRFTQMDTYPLLNRYTYANDNPIMQKDPSGHIAAGQGGSGTPGLEEDAQDLFNLGVNSNDFMHLLSNVTEVAVVEDPVSAPEAIVAEVGIEEMVGAIDAKRLSSVMADVKDTVSPLSENDEGWQHNDHLDIKSMESLDNSKEDAKTYHKLPEYVTGENYRFSDAMRLLQKKVSPSAFEQFGEWGSEQQARFLRLPAFDRMSTSFLEYYMTTIQSPEKNIADYLQRIIDLNVKVEALDFNIAEYLRLQDVFDQFGISQTLEPAEWSGASGVKNAPLIVGYDPLPES